MEHPVTAIYDANILYPAPLRDLFIRLAQVGLVRARWTEAIHDEWMRNVIKDRPELTTERLARTRSLMNEAVREAIHFRQDRLCFAKCGVVAGPPPQPEVNDIRCALDAQDCVLRATA
jgi:hypothetical protein